MTSLKDFQASFQDAILSKDPEALLQIIPDSALECKQKLFGVYQNAYALRLLDILKSDFEKLHAYLGDDLFDDIAQPYPFEVPSNHPNGRWFSHNFPEFIRKSPLLTDIPEAAELAELERALADMFDAEEKPVLTIDHLGTVPAEDWGALIFAPQPATRLLKFRTNAADIWSALHDEQAPPTALKREAPEYVLCYREQRMSKFRLISEEEAILWKELCKETTFAGLCEIGATYGGEDEAPIRAATYLNGWISAGLLVAPSVE